MHLAHQYHTDYWVLVGGNVQSPAVCDICAGGGGQWWVVL